MLSLSAQQEAAPLAKTFAERFYSDRRRLRPRIQQLKKQGTYEGNNPQIKRALSSSTTEAKITPENMKKVSDCMREHLGLLNPTAPPDPDGIDDYREFLSGPRPVLGLRADETLIDPMQTAGQLADQFHSAMRNSGVDTYIMEPTSKTSSILHTFLPLGVGGAIAGITYKGIMLGSGIDSVFGEMLKNNAFTLSLNVMFVASKTVSSVMQDDFGGWNTIMAAPLELLRRLAPTITQAGIGYLFGGVILGFAGGTIGYIIAKLIVDYATRKVIGIAIKKILINKDAFEDAIMEQTTTEEMVKKMNAEMLADDGTSSIYRMPLLFRSMIANENLRTVALCSPIIASGLMYNSYGSSWVDWVIDQVVIKSLLNPALCKLLAKAMASKWVGTVSQRACSDMWKLAKRVLPKNAAARLEKYAHDYMVYHHLCQIVSVLLQNGSVMFLNQKLTMGAMKGGIVDLIESRYMPSFKDQETDLVQGPLAAEYLSRPSNTFRLINFQLQQLQRQQQKDQIRLGRLRLWSLASSEEFSALPVEDRSHMSIAMGEGVHPNGITFSDVLNFRARAGTAIANAEWRLLEDRGTYIDRILNTKGEITDKAILLKAVMQSELEMIEKYGVSLDRLQTMKTVWPEDIIKEFAKMYQLDHGSSTNLTRLNFQTARLSMAYADLDESEINELPSTSDTPDALSMRQFTTRIYNGGSFFTESVSIEGFQRWQKEARDSGLYEKWEGLVKWHNYMMNVDAQNARIQGAAIPTKAATEQQTGPLPSGQTIDTSPITTSNVGDTLGAVSSTGDPIIPVTTTRDTALFTKIGETVISSSMKQAVTYATSNRLGNIRELVHMMYFGGLDAVIRMLSGIDGGREVNAPSNVPNITDELDKMKPQGVSNCLLYAGKWHLSDDGTVIDENGQPVDSKCVMRPVMGDAIKFSGSIIFNILSFVINSYAGAGFFSKITRAAGGNLGPAGIRKVLIDMCANRASKLGCGLSSIPIPATAGPERDRMTMCHFNNLLLNFLCVYTSGGQIGGMLLSTGTNCDRVAMFADVRELGLNAQGLASMALDLTSDMASISTRVTQIGSTWRSYLSIPGLFTEVMTKIVSALFNSPESMWPLIAGSADISTARLSFEQVQREISSGRNSFVTMLEQWYAIE